MFTCYRRYVNLLKKKKNRVRFCCLKFTQVYFFFATIKTVTSEKENDKIKVEPFNILLFINQFNELFTYV